MRAIKKRISYEHMKSGHKQKTHQQQYIRIPPKEDDNNREPYLQALEAKRMLPLNLFQSPNFSTKRNIKSINHQ